MTLRTLETAAWFALYAGIIAFLLSWNSASPLYNAIYVEHTQSDWLPDADRRYMPGAVISAGEPNASFAGGWWRPERQARWGRGTHNRLVLQPTADLQSGSRIVARIGVLPRRDGSARRVVIEVDDIERERVDLVDGAAREIEIALLTDVAAGSDLRITFVVPEAASPLLEGHGADQRIMGVRFYDLAILPP